MSKDDSERLTEGDERPDEPPDAVSGSGDDRDAGAYRQQSLDKREDKLDQRELGLDKRAEKLDKRAEKLEEREDDLNEREEELDEIRAKLEQRAEEHETREAELDERESVIADREAQLDEREAELDRVESTLETYVGDQLSGAEESINATVEEAVSSAISSYSGGDGSTRLGTIGNLLLGLLGVTLVVGGVSNVLAAYTTQIPTLVASSSGNIAISAVLIFAGLATNLAAAANQV